MASCRSRTSARRRRTGWARCSTCRTASHRTTPSGGCSLCWTRRRSRPASWHGSGPSPSASGEVVAIDGKTARRSMDAAGNRGPIHLVNAWATANPLVLGQVRTSDKSNGITAIPELLRVLDLAGCIVTIDAMGCQKAIAADIVEQDTHYMLALKENHLILHHEVRGFFEDGILTAFDGIEHDVHVRDRTLQPRLQGARLRSARSRRRSRGARQPDSGASSPASPATALRPASPLGSSGVHPRTGACPSRPPRFRPVAAPCPAPPLRRRTACDGGGLDE